MITLQMSMFILRLWLLVTLIVGGQSAVPKGSDNKSAQCGLWLLRPNGSRRFFISDGARFGIRCTNQEPNVPEDDIRLSCIRSFKREIVRYPLNKASSSNPETTLGDQLCARIRPGGQRFRLGYFYSFCGGNYTYTLEDGPEKVCCNRDQRYVPCS